MIMRMLRFLLRWTLYIALAVFGVLAILYAGLLYVNWQDDPPDPQIAATLNTYPAQIPAERNGYFAWIGVMGPETVPPHEWGRRWFEQAKAIDAIALPDQPAIVPASAKEARKDDWPNDGLCRNVRTCLDDVAADTERARAMLAGVRTTLERGEAAMAYPEYQEPARPEYGGVSPDPARPLAWLAASNTRFALAVAAEQHAEALNRKSREMKFYVAQAAGAENLIDKMLALTYLHNDYLLLAYYSRHHPQQALAYHAQIKAMLAPLPPEATSLAAPIRTQMRSLVRFHPLMRASGAAAGLEMFAGERGFWHGLVSNKLLLPLLLPQASANLTFSLEALYLDAELKESAEAYRAALNDAFEQNQAYRKSLLDRIVTRNLVGRILVGIGGPDFRNYQFRRDDLLALRAAVAMRHDQRAAGWSAARMREMCAAPELVQRMTGSGPQWDEEQQALVYEANPLRKGGGTLSVPM